jgi:hypothetical protein
MLIRKPFLKGSGAKKHAIFGAKNAESRVPSRARFRGH